MSTRTTLKDVAKTAGVSQMTVSRVVHNRGYISQSTRKRVEETINQMGYVPNQLAGSLATQRSNQVAVIISSLGNNVFTQLLDGVTKEFGKAGYNAVIGVTDYDMHREEELLLSMMSWRPAGVIVTNLTHTERSRNILKNADVPVVEVMDVGASPIDMGVGLDHAAAARKLVDYLIGKKYQRFGYLGWSSNDFSSATRFEATRAQLEKHGFSLYAPDLFDAPPDAFAGKLGMIKLLEERPDIDVVMYSNDLAAIGGMMHCLENGIQVPDDIAVTGFSGLKISRTTPKALTTIVTHRFQTGRIAARNILNSLTGSPVQKVTDLGFELYEGGST